MSIWISNQLCEFSGLISTKLYRSEHFRSSFVHHQFEGQNLMLTELLTIEFRMALELFLQSIVKFVSITLLILCGKFPLNFTDVISDG